MLLIPLRIDAEQRKDLKALSTPSGAAVFEAVTRPAGRDVPIVKLDVTEEDES